MKIGNFDTDEKVLIIAEIGNNHEGCYSLAEEMIGQAAEVGADAVKFQTFIPDRLVSASQVERIKQLERFRLSYEEFERLSRVAERENILFLSTPFDLESVRFLGPLVPVYKISSGDNTFFPLIEEVAKTNKPIILSAGMMDLDEVIRTRDFIYGIWDKGGYRQDLAILHCVSSYPTPSSEANLLAIPTLKKLGVTVGYSDHTLGIEAAVLSVALGARIIEKHFTLDKNYSDFHDHALSADPDEFACLVQRVKEVLQLLGNGRKWPAECEREGKRLYRRSIVAAEDLEAGTRLEWKNLSWIRPGGGLSPGQEGKILGKVLNRPVKRGEMILPEAVE